MKYIVPVWVFLMMGLMTPLDGVTLAGEADLLNPAKRLSVRGNITRPKIFSHKW